MEASTHFKIEKFLNSQTLWGIIPGTASFESEKTLSVALALLHAG
jgi:hypothetical protein